MKRLNKRRRLENKTDYRKRLILLKGNIPRLVVRKTNKYIILQIIHSVNAIDKVIVSANSKELLKYGWSTKNSGSLKSLAAAYLAGILISKRAEDKNISKLVLDAGLSPNTRYSRIYAVVKGVIDNGLDMPHDENILPNDEMINKYEFLNEIKEKLNGKEKQ